jgi:hypothetical protein
MLSVELTCKHVEHVRNWFINSPNTQLLVGSSHEVANLDDSQKNEENGTSNVKTIE